MHDTYGGSDNFSFQAQSGKMKIIKAPKFSEKIGNTKFKPKEKL